MLKDNRPVALLAKGSGAVGGFSLLLCVVIHWFLFDIPIYSFLLIPMLTAVFTFFVFRYILTVFLNSRLKIIYRTIRKGKITKDNPINFSFSEDVITNVEREANEWSEAKNLEISKLKEQEEFRREFLGNLAHELKTPVFSIQGYVLTLLEGALEDQQVNRMFLERASKSIERMTSILEDLDQITRLEVDDLKLEIRPFDIFGLTQEVFDLLEMLANEKKISLTFAKEAYSSIMVLGEKSKIAQVLTNLVTNSIFYGNKGGETTVRFYILDEIVTVEISDNGPGIEDKYISRLFERFYRVEKSRNRNDGGSGLGLAIVKHLIEAHGQTISVRSTVGVGSTFSFSLDKSKSSVNTLYSSRGIPIK
jgi:two-component system, OmpR family, phosphate regulon sensor histidine kinase PhoR